MSINDDFIDSGISIGNKDNIAYVQQQPPPDDLIVNPVTNPELEIFECVKCSHPNVLKKTARRRRQTRVRHLRVDDLVWASMKRFLGINNVDFNYGLLLLLMHAKTQNIDYVINESAMTLALPKNKPKRGKKKTSKPSL